MWFLGRISLSCGESERLEGSFMRVSRGPMGILPRPITTLYPQAARSGASGEGGWGGDLENAALPTRGGCTERLLFLRKGEARVIRASKQGAPEAIRPDGTPEEPDPDPRAALFARRARRGLGWAETGARTREARSGLTPRHGQGTSAVFERTVERCRRRLKRGGDSGERARRAGSNARALARRLRARRRRAWVDTMR